MRKLRLEDLENTIEKNRKKVNEQIFNSRGEQRLKKSRFRALGEQEALNQISVKRWQIEVEKGYIKK